MIWESRYIRSPYNTMKWMEMLRVTQSQFYRLNKHVIKSVGQGYASLIGVIADDARYVPLDQAVKNDFSSH